MSPVVLELVVNGNHSNITNNTMSEMCKEVSCYTLTVTYLATALQRTLTWYCREAASTKGSLATLWASCFRLPPAERHRISTLHNPGTPHFTANVFISCAEMPQCVRRHSRPTNQSQSRPSLTKTKDLIFSRLPEIDFGWSTLILLGNFSARQSRFLLA